MDDAENFFLTKLLQRFAYDPETKQQSSEWVGETFHWTKSPKFQRFRIKTMLIIISTLKA
jgi:hypothetical protein